MPKETSEKISNSKSSQTKSVKKRSYQKKTVSQQFEKELHKIPEKMQDIIINGILRDLLIIIFVPLIYNSFRVNWSQIVTLPILPDVILHQIGNIIVLIINLYEWYFDLHEKRSIATAVSDFIVNIIFGLTLLDPTFIVMGVGYILIGGIRIWLKHQKKQKMNEKNQTTQ